MAFLPTVPFLTLLRNSPPSTLAWRSPARPAGSYLTTAAPPNAFPLRSSLSLGQRHATWLPAAASPPFQQHLRLNTTSASTATPNVMAATNLATTPYAAPMHPAVAGVLELTLPGITLVPLPPATRRAVHAHTPRLSVLHVPDLMRHTLPSAPTALPLSPVRGVWRMMRCTSTGGLSLFSYLWAACLFLPGVGGMYPLTSPGFLLLTPLARRTDQALHLEAYGTWWRGSRWWFSFIFWLWHYVWGPSFPCFRSAPSNSRVLSAVVGTFPAGCFTSSTLLLHYLQEWA